MAKGLRRSLARAAAQERGVRHLRVRDINIVVNVDGATGVGFGSAAIRGFPEGNLLLLGAVAYATVDDDGHANVTEDFVGDFGIGTTPASDATISGTDEDIIVETALAAATDGVSPRTRAVNATTAVLDNTAGTAEINFNLLIDDAEIDADDIDMLVDLELDIAYMVMGDD